MSSPDPVALIAALTNVNNAVSTLLTLLIQSTPQQQNPPANPPANPPTNPPANPPANPPTNPPANPPATNSTVVVAPKTDTVKDSAGNVFAFGDPMLDMGSTVWGYRLKVNGTMTKGVSVLIAVVNGVLYSMNCLGQWTMYANGNFSNATPSPMPKIASPEGTTISDVGQYLIDSAGKVFMFWSHLDPTYGASVTENGNELGNIGTMSLTVKNGLIVSKDAKGVLQHWNGTQFVAGGA